MVILGLGHCKFRETKTQREKGTCPESQRREKRCPALPPRPLFLSLSHASASETPTLDEYV